MLKFEIMKKNTKSFALIVSALLFSTVMVLGLNSCKGSDPEPEPTPAPHWYSPLPGEDGTLPTVVLPDSLIAPVEEYFTVHQGTNPPTVEGRFVSHPHMLLHSTFEADTVTLFNDRYIAFFGNNEKIDFYGKQWDDEYESYYEEAYRGLYVIGTGEEFSCYYLTEGYPNGMFARQSTIFSGKWNENYGGLKDFQVAVILLETSGNPNLAPVGSFRVLGDGDGLAQDTLWMAKSSYNTDMNVSHEDAFRMFRVK